MQKIAADETAANAKLAQEEWTRETSTAEVGRSFSAAPSLSIQPTELGINVVLRYITRASERYEIKTRLYRAAVDILHKRKNAGAEEMLPPRAARGD